MVVELKTKNPVREDAGESKLKRPYTMTLEQEKKLVEEARAKMKALLEIEHHEEYFASRVNYHGVKVSQKKDGAFCIAKGTTDVPEGITLDEIRAQFDGDFRNLESVDRLFQRIDPMMQYMTIVTELQHKDELLDASKHEQYRVLYGNVYVAPLVSNRDFCFCQFTCRTNCPITGQDLFCSSSYSIDLPDAAPDMEKSLGRVRADLQLTGYVFRPHPTNANQLTMSYLGQCDPRGYLPTSVVNLASISQALNAGRVRDLYVELNTVKKKMGGDFTYPLDCYNVARRGGSCIHPVPLVAPKVGTKTFFVHLRAHSEHNVNVEIANKDGPFNISNVDGDAKGEDMVNGKAVTFGGDNTLDIVLQVTLEKEEKAELDLKFINSGWRKSHVVLPVSMSISASNPAAASTAEQ